MGCTSSMPSPRSDVPEQDIIRKCKDRRLIIKEAIRCREKFAIVHLEYLESLRNVGSLITEISGAGEAVITKPASPIIASPRSPDPPPKQVSNVILALPPPVPQSEAGKGLSANSASRLTPPASPSNVTTGLPASPSKTTTGLPASPSNISTRLTPPASPSKKTTSFTPPGSPSNITTVLPASPSKKTTRLASPDSPSNFTTGLSASPSRLTPPGSPSNAKTGLPDSNSKTTSRLTPPDSPSTTALPANPPPSLTHPDSPRKITTIAHFTPPGSPPNTRDFSSNSDVSVSPRPAENDLIFATIQSPAPNPKFIESLTSPNEPLMAPPTPPFSIQGSPPLSPLKLTDEPLLPLVEYRSISLLEFARSPTSSSMDETMFTDKGSDYFSPSRDDLEDYSPSPSSSPIEEFSWESRRVFMPSDIPLRVHDEGKIELAVHKATEMVHVHGSDEDEDVDHSPKPSPHHDHQQGMPELVASPHHEHGQGTTEIDVSHHHIHEHEMTELVSSPHHEHEQGMTEIAVSHHHIHEQEMPELISQKLNESTHTEGGNCNEPENMSYVEEEDIKVEPSVRKSHKELEMNANQSVNGVHMHCDSDKDEGFIPDLEEVISHNKHEVNMEHLSDEDEDIPELEEVDFSGSECQNEDEEMPYLEDSEHVDGETVMEWNGVKPEAESIDKPHLRDMKTKDYSQLNCEGNTEERHSDTDSGDVNHFTQNGHSDTNIKVVKEDEDAKFTHIDIKLIPKEQSDDVKHFPENKNLKENEYANTNTNSKVLQEGHLDTEISENKNMQENGDANTNIASKVLQEGHPAIYSNDSRNLDNNAAKEEDVITKSEENFIQPHTETISISNDNESKAVPEEVIRKSSETHIESKSSSKEDEIRYSPPIFRVFSNIQNVTTSAYEDAHDKAFSKEFVRLSSLSMNHFADHINNYKKENPILDYGGDLPEILYHIDEQFVKAHKSGDAVSKILESDQISGSNIWKISTYKMKKMKEDFRVASHASTLDRLHAWEKKLHDEVKDGELIQMTLDQRCQQLHELNVKGSNHSLIDKAKVILKDLSAELLVAYRAMQITSTKIQNITNEELFPQILDLVNRLRSMWQTMTECHHIQQMLALELHSFENSIIGDELSESRIRAMFDLQNELRKWQTNIYYLIRYQKHYIKHLHTWLGLCYETDSDDNTNNKMRGHGRRYNSAPKVRTPLYNLLKEWADSIESLESYEKAIDSMSRFDKAVHMLERVQYHGLKSKRHGERSASSRMDQPGFSFRKIYEDNLHSFAESLRRDISQSRRRKTERYDPMDDLEIYTILDLFKHHLPRVFEDLASFSKDAWMMYENVLQKANEKLDEDVPSPCSDIVPYIPPKINGS